MIKEDYFDVIACYFCGQEHHYSEKKENFPENKLVVKLIDFNAQNLNIEKCITESVESYEELKTKIDDLEKASSNPSSYLHEYFVSLKNRIDLKKTECDLTADKIHKKMLHDLRIFENECQNAIDIVKKDKITIDLNNLKDNLNHIKRDIFYLQNTNDKSQIDSINSEILKLKSTVDYELNELKDKLFLGMEFSFEPKHLSMQSNLFGLFKMVY